MGEYIFSNASPLDEFERLRLLESIFDDTTRAWILGAMKMQGRRCLEVGAGAGSVARWLAEQVGSRGKVLAVDTNERFLRELGSTAELLCGDIRELSVTRASYDLAHARYVLVHNTDAGSVLDVMTGALKPDGLLFVEEPDFSTAKALLGPLPMKASFDAMTRAMELTFGARGMDYAFGRILPSLIESRCAQIESIAFDSHVHRGGSAVARMMSTSALALKDKYIDTGAVTAADIAAYCRFAADPTCWAVYYTTVRVLARKATSQ